MMRPTYSTVWHSRVGIECYRKKFHNYIGYKAGKVGKTIELYRYPEAIFARHLPLVAEAFQNMAIPTQLAFRYGEP